ncbi:asparagine synthase (glutamine-hydrolyzing) [Couchioplanes caeruleus]|uniref:asparagine synthase (glutamine-hydrolyzing) n=1 Tax=Couchioplanes caeruleus TaxID=56438 RepID=A0A3N1GM91_9ACTN|nr:asparagine synthase (glutamine-hydrolyzing) [Couchioplanes caeruleus]ROP31348.1 asparagine synthase (glutamine-hydrolysing) [Couchioplanes caeruleus]
MCGIAGWVDHSRDISTEHAIVAAMSETMCLRGPDDAGVWVDGNVALCHRRLAIIDIAGGRQPMHAVAGVEEKPVVLVYTGEVYNYRELRAELASLGHSFGTRSDTEVVLRAYLQWGAASATRLRGMFAYAVWDGRERELILVRDRLGVKPLYYAPQPAGLLFASEPKGILAHPSYRAAVDESSLNLLLEPRLALPGETPYRGMNTVKPGHYVRVGRDGVREHEYWRIPAREHHDDLPTTVGRIRELLGDVVEQQMFADVPVATMLSGGLDSSAITALGARYTKRHGLGPLSTFSVQFKGEENDFHPTVLRPERDAPYAKLAAEYLGTSHTAVEVDSHDVLAARSAALRARDLPSYGQFDTSMYLLFKAMRENYTAALSGEAADELFGGYPWFHDPAVVWRDRFPWLGDAPRLADCLNSDIRARLNPADNEHDRYRTLRARVPRLDGESELDARMREVLFFSLQGPLAALLDRKDRMSMAVGLEVRVPFCDHELLEYVYNIPWTMKTSDGREKSLLRSAMADLLPQEILYRPKNAYPALHAHHHDALVRDEILAMLKDPDSPLAPALDTDRVREFVDDEKATMTHVNTIHLVQPLLEIDRWMRTYHLNIS